MTPLDALARLGVDPGAVARVIITHFHWDHIGNVDAFDDAELFLPERELEFWGAPVARNIQFWSAVDPDPLAYLADAHRRGRAVATGADETIVPGHDPAVAERFASLDGDVRDIVYRVA